MRDQTSDGAEPAGGDDPRAAARARDHPAAVAASPMEVDAELLRLLPRFPTAGVPRRSWRQIRAAVSAGITALGRDLVDETIQRSAIRIGVRGSAVWFEPVERSSAAAAVFAHGGGMVAGSVEVFAPFIARYVALSGVPLLAVEYGLAPETRGTAAAEQLFAALEHLTGAAGGFGLDPHRIAVIGESAGGGLAAGAAILARNRSVPLAAQILVQPMLDDRVVKRDPHLAGRLTWSYDDDATGWTAMLGSHPGPSHTSPVAAPARLMDLRALAPAWIEVGASEIYRDPAIAYATRLAEAGVPIELHVLRGAVHAFDQLAPNAAISVRALQRRADALRRL